MKPVKNTSTRFLDVGDIWQDKRVVRLIPCTDATFCSNHYRNFGVSCGGHRRRLDGVLGEAICCFFLVGDHFLAAEQDGRPIGVGGEFDATS